MFEKGRSGNPSGRPVGIGRVTELKRLLFCQSEEIIQAVIDKAIAGDTAAMKLILDRLIPQLKAADLPVAIPHADSGDIADQSHIISNQLLSGGLSADTAARIMQSLVLHQTICELKNLESRIAALEKGNDNPTSTTG